MERGEQLAVVGVASIRDRPVFGFRPRVLISSADVHRPRLAETPVVFRISCPYLLVVGSRDLVVGDYARIVQVPMATGIGILAAKPQASKADVDLCRVVVDVLGDVVLIVEVGSVTLGERIVADRMTGIVHPHPVVVEVVVYPGTTCRLCRIDIHGPCPCVFQAVGLCVVATMGVWHFRLKVV